MAGTQTDAIITKNTSFKKAEIKPKFLLLPYRIFQKIQFNTIKLSPQKKLAGIPAIKKTQWQRNTVVAKNWQN